MAIRTMIVDDEPLARRRLRSLLTTDSECELVEECGDGSAAVEAIARLKPDLVFLDVQMPGMDGFDVLREVSLQHSPRIIFVTAYDRYAVRAFDLHAVDYLLKPFKRTRFFEAVRRAKESLRKNEPTRDDNIVGLLNEMSRDRKRLVVRAGGRIAILLTDEIDYVQAAANYVCVHSGTREYQVRDTMNAFEKKLPERQFLRVHRSIIVNADRIRELEPCNGAEYIMILRNGKELPVGRSYRAAVESFLYAAQ